jgi:myo-inositol-1(or 4)-monophosphatase
MRGLEADLQLALGAVAAAGEAVMQWFGRELEVTHKAPDQPLTAADLEADGILRERLLAGTPGYGWLSEETADRPDRLGCDRVWIVDPIDGTRSFIAGRPEFAISVGLAENGRAILGIVSNPAARELYWALAGQGCFRRDHGGVESRMQVQVSAGPRSLLASRSELAAGELEPFRESWQLQPLGSTAYKLAWVAAGEGSAFVSRGPKSEWDVCAGALLVAEAGGIASDLDGRSLSYNRADPYVQHRGRQRGRARGRRAHRSCHPAGGWPGSAPLPGERRTDHAVPVGTGACVCARLRHLRRSGHARYGWTGGPGSLAREGEARGAAPVAGLAQTVPPPGAWLTDPRAAWGSAVEGQRHGRREQADPGWHNPAARSA